MRARIRDFFQTVDGWIFAVVDYHHPDGIRSILRYVPDPAGERDAGGVRYRKLDFEEAYDLLRKERPDYVQDVHVVPEEDIRRIYRPDEELPKAAERDGRIAEIVSVLRKGGVPDGKMGITGSVLVGLEGTASDIDFLVYGAAWWRARDVLASAKEEGGRIRDLDEATWDKIYRKRAPDIDRREFVLHERRKGNRGLVDATYFDLLFTRDWDQIAPPFPPGEKKGRLEIEATVLDAEFAFDNPAIFEIDHPEISAILCYTHTYAGQAVPGERIEASGVVEEMVDGKRLVVGTTREAKGEWIRSLTLLEKASSR
ncbi:DNA polymerase subunit beta [Candidatus Methanocrinis natronophilus]|uniref:DNA polymerase subunit beta n=1 Tax=Candidatus Methanocrinis natronophilus TaxID=3033396 RepID=A0ABT5X4U5_9EURY|nr:DNA polymerase subunit beta [Candidatus Methanocrinis natronophilus]MDF0589718.1 DNA polymerase subunit beta [Candidatus Methanocrinis natronophilus]